MHVLRTLTRHRTPPEEKVKSMLRFPKYNTSKGILQIKIGGALA